MARTPAASTMFGGAALALRGVRLALGSAEVRRVYVQLALTLVVTTLALMGGLGWAIWRWTPNPEDAAAWLRVLLWTLRLGGTARVMLAAPLMALFIVNIGLPFLGERVFMAGLREADPARASALEAAVGADLRTSVGSSLRRLLYFVGITLLTFALTLVPVLGAVLGPAAQLWFTARMLSWELLDPYFERRGLTYAEQRALLRSHRTAMFGFGAPWTLLLALPIVGPLGFGVAQAAAALLALEVVDETRSPTSSRS